MPATPAVTKIMTDRTWPWEVLPPAGHQLKLLPGANRKRGRSIYLRRLQYTRAIAVIKAQRRNVVIKLAPRLRLFR
jgi:hypothetical protein